MSLVWNNLSYSTEVSPFEALLSAVSMGKLGPKKKGILQCAQGNVELGEMVALMGPSGAGKSTLLNCLVSGRSYPGCNGEIYVTGFNGEPIRASMINQNEGEHLLHSLTVWQSLVYASRLKNPPETPSEIHEEVVKDLIKELNLKSCENAVVENCSGGEKKRLAIGLELAAFKKPHFLFLDEITSGLDSFVGYKVIKLLSRLAKAHNMAIVTTIHQPSYKLLVQFDKAYVLSGTGEVIFSGKPPDLRGELEHSGYNFATGLYENPADVVIELASSMKRSARVIQELPLTFYNIDNLGLVESQDDISVDGSLSSDNLDALTFQEVCKRMLEKTRLGSMQFIQHFQELRGLGQVSKQESGLCRNETSFSFYTLRILLSRCFQTSIVKQTRFTFLKLFLHLVVAVVLAMLYKRNIGKADSCITFIYPESDSQNCSCSITPDTLKGRNAEPSNKNVTFQFFSLLFLMFASLMPTVLSFPSEMKLFLCEFRNSWYSTSVYYIAKTLIEIPFQLIFPALYVYFLFWYSSQLGMDDWYDGIPGMMSARYSHFFCVTILCCFIAQGLGFLIGILCVRSFNISIILSSSLLLFLFLFSGFFVKKIQMSDNVSWLTYFSFVRFGLESLLIIIYGDQRCVKPKYSSVLVIFGLEDDGLLPFNVQMLVVHLAVTRLMAFILFKYKADPAIFRINLKVPSSFCKMNLMFRSKRLVNEEPRF